MQKIAHLPATMQFTTAITLGEIYFGAGRSSRKDQILKAFEESVFPNINILPFDAERGHILCFLKAELEKAGIGCSEPYLRIVAITLPHRLVLITGNVRHFQNIQGLKAENWMD